jgi:vesicle-associated membrane protein 72
MPLIYSSVSHGTTTIAEHAAFSGNFASVAKEFLDKAGKNEGKFTYTVDGHTFNFLTKAGYSE